MFMSVVSTVSAPQSLDYYFPNSQNTSLYNCHFQFPDVYSINIYFSNAKSMEWALIVFFTFSFLFSVSALSVSISSRLEDFWGQWKDVLHYFYIPLNRMAIDILRPIPKSYDEYKYIMVVEDYFSK